MHLTSPLYYNVFQEHNRILFPSLHMSSVFPSSDLFFSVALPTFCRACKGQQQKTMSALLLEFQALCPPCFFLFLLLSYLVMITSYAFERFYGILVWLWAPPISISPAALGENCFLKAHTHRASINVCSLETMGILCPVCFPQVLCLLSWSHKGPRSWSLSWFYS